MTKTQAELALEALDVLAKFEKDHNPYDLLDMKLMAALPCIRAALAQPAPQKDETGMPREIWVVGDVHNSAKHWFDFPVTCSEKYLRADLVEKDRK